MAVDSSGNLYIADTQNHRIRKVDNSGNITTFAGTGESGCCVDGGPATSARMTWPQGLAVDGSGNLYIADAKVTAAYGAWIHRELSRQLQQGLTGPKASRWTVRETSTLPRRNGHRIRRVDAMGTITTIAGTGARGFSGDGGLATGAMLDSPWDVAVDTSGNLYIADYGNRRVRRVDTSGTITTVAGIGYAIDSGGTGPAIEAVLTRPGGVAVDSSGNLYIADYGNHRIKQVDSSGTLTTIAGTGMRGDRGDGGKAT